MWKKLLISDLSHIEIKQDELLQPYTYTKTGGKAEILALPNSIEQVQQLVLFAKKHDVKLTILGNGSNVIVKDSGITGIVIMLERLTQVAISGTTIVVGSGVKLVELSKMAAKAQLTGLEFACGIPGSVGGAVYMNAGAYGGEMKDIIQSVTVITRDGSIKQLSNDDMAFAYRHSVIQETGDIAIETTLQLANGNQTDIDAKIAHLTQLREEKQPLEYPSCGSVFKRPEGYFAGKLIQDAKLQGYRIGGVEVSKKHAGFMVNVDHGTASDYKALIAHVQHEVYEKFGVKLEAEVRFIGD